MGRNSFAQKLALLGVCPSVVQNLADSDFTKIPQEQNEKLSAVQGQKQLVENWLA
jgi:hypothetical protein